MEQENFLPEEILIERMQKGEIGSLEYVRQHSQEWQQEYETYCLSKGLSITEDSAVTFLAYKDKQLEDAMADGDA